MRCDKHGLCAVLGLVVAATAQGPYLIAEVRDATPITMPWIGYKFDLGDLNGDAIIDAAQVDESGIYVFLNAGNGRSQAWQQRRPAPTVVNGSGLIDLDLDGDLDAIAVTSTTDPVVLLNDGTGRFSAGAAANFFASPGPRGGRVLARDFDRDGRTDLLISGETYQQCQLFLHQADGRFRDVTSTHMPPLAVGIYDFACADLDGDGDLDVVATVIDTYGQVLLNDGAGRFTAVPLVTGRLVPHYSVALVDLNRDGLPDIFLGGYRTSSEFWLNMAGGNFLEVSSLVSAIPTAIAAVGGDIDGDGWDDLIVAGENNPTALELWRNRAGQGFDLVPSGIRQPTVFGWIFKPYVQDMDADGDLDLATAAGAYMIGYRYWFIPNTTRHVETLPPVRVGGTFNADLWGSPGQWMFPMISFRGARFDLGSFGVLGLDPTQGLLLPPVLLTGRKARLSLRVPRGSAGLRLFTQALVYDPQAPSLTRLTNWMYDDIVQ